MGSKIGESRDLCLARGVGRPDYCGVKIYKGTRRIRISGLRHQVVYGEEIRFETSTQMLSLLWAAITGLVVGAIAKLVMPGKDPGGVWITMALGIAGSLIATYLGRLIGWYREGQAAGLVMSILGAILLLGIYRLVRRTRARS
jgi:uncharacterized membrane protein YeaQ/YmgE (transglycosylase-associated protein family)